MLLIINGLTMLNPSILLKKAHEHPSLNIETFDIYLFTNKQVVL
jgi:hypothetical protein